MRRLTLVLSFSAGAWLMWTMAPPLAAVAPAAAAEAGSGLRPAMRVVLYDPHLEPVRHNARPAVAGWSSAEAAVEGPPGSVTPASSDRAGLQVAGLGRPGARGACAVFNGKTLHCVALFAPMD